MRKYRPRGSPKIECSKCGNPIEENRHKKQRYCKTCHVAHMRTTRPKHSDLKPEARMKANARAYLKEYIKRGKIIKLPCVVCGDINSEAHHDDYSKPLQVTWVCRKHHLSIHRA